VNVRLTLDTIRNAVVVPSGAVQRGPNGPFVYGIADDKAVLKNVEVGRQDETSSIITSGLTPPERVITTGFARLTNGDPVRIVDPAPPTADASSGTGAAPAGPPRLSEERRRRTEPGATAGDRIEGDRPRRRRQEGQAAGPRAPGSARVE
jgi:multidrug efflux system membrane fusion protein